MHASAHLRLLALLLVAGTSNLVSASPAPAPDGPTSVSLPPTEPWVAVGTDGVPRTVTPVLTTVDGMPTVVSAAPTTSPLTTTATTTAQPEATATSGAGSFPVCSNAGGDLAPFCAPADASTLNPGATYYITWDPHFFASAPNTTVIITGNLFNATTGAITTQAFSSGTLAAAWSFYAWTVDSSLLNGAPSAGVNISISMAYLSGTGAAGGANSTATSSTSHHIHGPIITVATPQPYRQPHAKPPTGLALYIGLPCVLGFVALMLVGTCLWNRRTRKIGLGNIMSRTRFGKLGESRGYGIRKSRRQRVGAVHLDSKDAIRLQSREVLPASDDGEGGRAYSDYHDHSPYGSKEAPPSLSLSGDHWGSAMGVAPPRVPSAEEDRPRRDSDALGSLAGTPTEDRRFADFHRPRPANNGSGSNNAGSTGNAFRDELRRQEGLL